MAGGPRAIRRLEAISCGTVHAVPWVAIVRAGVLVGDDQITWATAMPAASDVTWAVADGYSVRARIAPKQ